MLDSQYEVTEQTAVKWRESVRTMRAMKEAGYANEAGVAQYEANTLAIEASLHDIAYQRTQIENSLCSLLGEVPHTIGRGNLDNQQLPDDLTVGVPVQMLSNRPDVRSAEYSLMQSYYATASARSALYPSITLSGSVGWTNSSGAGIVNPGKLLWSSRRIAPATDLQRQRQPCPREDRQGTAGGDQAGVPADSAQRRCRGEQRPYAVPVGPREGGPPRAADSKAPERKQLQGFDPAVEAEVLSLLPEGLHDAQSDTWGWNFKWGTTGLCPIGDGYFYISHNAKDKQTGNQSSTVQLYKWTGNPDKAFEPVE